jgi:glycosyltransferase involved in cell wall biosynthesis
MVPFEERGNLSEKKLRILVISAHPPIDSELTSNWVKLGYQVYLFSNTVKWEDQYNILDSAVVRGVPENQPDLIIAGHITDTFYAVYLKIKKRWFRSKLVMIHWWFPIRVPILYLFKNISVCEYERRYLKKILGISSGVAYCPVDTAFFRKTGDITNPSRILVIGNGFKERKIMGYNHLIKIIDRIHLKHPEFSIVIMGNNKREDFPEYVSIINCNKDEMRSEINKSSVVFFTTTHNLIMNSLQIAMACERKVVAFDLEPFREVIKDGISGYLIPNFNENLFANTVIEAALNSNIMVGKLARESIVEKCESSKVSSLIISLATNASK